MKRIVIIGGGFGGIFTAKHLLRKIKNDTTIEVYLLNKTNYFLFSPMLHEVATGGLNRQHIVQPIREILNQHNFHFVRCLVTSINTNEKTVNTDCGAFTYDILVIATGSEVNYYNVQNAAAYTIPLKTLQDSVAIRDRVIDALELAAASKSSKDKQKYLTFVVVGGGPTGVELAGELSEFLQQSLQENYSHLEAKDIHVYLIQRGDTILPFLRKKSREKAVATLTKKRVTVLTNSPVTKVSKESIEINTHKMISAYTLLWTPGVKPIVIPLIPNRRTKEGFLPVDTFLHVKGLTDVYALGDAALFMNEGEITPVPALAQTAVAQAPILARNIIHSLRNEPEELFFFKKQGLLVSIGQKFAVGEIGQFSIQGFFAWWLWRTIYLTKLVGWSNKLKVAWDWTLNLFFPRDTTQI